MGLLVGFNIANIPFKWNQCPCGASSLVVKAKGLMLKRSFSPSTTTIFNFFFYWAGKKLAFIKHLSQVPSS